MTVHAPFAFQLAPQAKWAFTTRRVHRGDAAGLIRDLGAARPGDLVLARIERIGSHKNVQLSEGRPSELYPGDLVVLACGARYAADQFEGVAELDPDGADMLAGGGVLGRMRAAHGRMSAPTRAIPLGLLADRHGVALNLARYAIAPAARPAGLTAICVVGASMNSGKTAATASLAHGLARAGRRVAAIKATGTGAFGDVNAYRDAGAHVALDFTDAGMASTYGAPHARIAAAIDALMAEAARAGADVAVVEVADGVLQTETDALLADPATRSAFAGVLFAAPDALAAVGGVAALARREIVPVALTGLIARAPLLVAEAEAATGLPILSREALRDPAEAIALLHRLEAPRAAAA
ncbi:MAG: hypothetical protein ACFCUS_09690 [Rubrimonas sp.]|uniref:hypothetical protein n=1 Tax=Rubrimonas sp. TaxID=2036015 RepID=UPI002FDE50B9